MSHDWDKLARRRTGRSIIVKGDGSCEWFYDRASQIWIVIRNDDHGFQVGECSYCMRFDLADTIRSMANVTLDELDPYRITEWGATEPLRFR